MEIDTNEFSFLKSNYSKVSETMRATTYAQIRDFIISLLQDGQEITFTELIEKAQADSRFVGIAFNLSWYILKVKQDLEAKKVISVRRAVGAARLQFISLNKTKRPRRLRGSV